MTTFATTTRSFPLPLDTPFTRIEAREAGISDRRLSELVDQRILRRPMRSVYVGAHVADSLELRLAVVRLAVPADSVVVDRTAAWLHGAPMVLAPNDHLVTPTVSVFRRAGHDRHRLTIATSGERTFLDEDITAIGGVQVTTPLRTALDLGRLLHRTQALAAMDSLLRLDAFSSDELLATVERFARQRGVVQLRSLAPLADGRSQSPGESALRLRWYDAGLPRPELQVPVLVNGQQYYLDLGLEGIRFAAEYDGWEWHSDSGDVEHDVDRRGQMSRHLGWHVEVFRDQHVYGRLESATDRLTRTFRAAQASAADRLRRARR